MIYYFSDNPGGFVTGKRFSVDAPCVTVMAAGMGGDSLGHWHFADDTSHTRIVKPDNKPSYRVPSMAEIAALPWNGFKVASTFSGAGGSCLGYRMAGFKVVWANEFVPMAQESYKANAAPDCVLDGRDIKHIQPHDILAATGLKVGELDLFDGSPPCQAFSTAGKREKGWGKEKTYEHGATQKNETLFDEYIRLLRGLQPKVFVAENVSGLVKGTAKGMFLQILAAMKASGYRVTCRVLDAQWLGVPQQRQRTIFIGVREDLNREPAHPLPLPYRYSVRDALPWITTIGSSNGFGESHQIPSNVPYHTVGTAPQQGNGLARFIESKVIHDTGGNNPNRWAANVDVTDKPCPAITVGINSINSNHFKVEAETDISRYAIGAEWDKLKQGEQSEKYFSLVKVDSEKPCNSIMATSGHFPSAAQPLHPTEKRKFTIAELRRICAFPDDFILCGSYAQQWERLGNSVPPVMMQAIATTVRDQILMKIQ